MIHVGSNVRLDLHERTGAGGQNCAIATVIAMHDDGSIDVEWFDQFMQNGGRQRHTRERLARTVTCVGTGEGGLVGLARKEAERERVQWEPV